MRELLRERPWHIRWNHHRNHPRSSLMTPLSKRQGLVGARIFLVGTEGSEFHR
jgi:hypothetical protein